VVKPTSSSEVKFGVSNIMFYSLTFCRCINRIVVLVLVRLYVLGYLKMAPRRQIM
jgi:hypothetical protein